MAALVNNRVSAIERSLSSNPVSAALIFFTENYLQEWSGTATALHDKLQEIAPAELKKHSNWPSKPNKLSAMIRRAAPFLRAKGIDVQWGKSGHRRIAITSLADKVKAAGNHQPESDVAGALDSTEQAPHSETKAAIVAKALDNNKPLGLDATATDTDVETQMPVSAPVAEINDVSVDESPEAEHKVAA